MAQKLWLLSVEAEEERELVRRVRDAEKRRQKMQCALAEFSRTSEGFNINIYISIYLYNSDFTRKSEGQELKASYISSLSPDTLVAYMLSFRARANAEAASFFFHRKGFPFPIHGIAVYICTGAYTSACEACTSRTALHY